MECACRVAPKSRGTQPGRSVGVPLAIPTRGGGPVRSQIRGRFRKELCHQGKDRALPEATSCATSAGKAILGRARHAISAAGPPG